MISLEEFNNLKYFPDLYTISYPHFNGIACPDCGKELYDTNASILTSFPPKRNVHCDCGYHGYRLA
jgi:hypothetical protein